MLEIKAIEYLSLRVEHLNQYFHFFLFGLSMQGIECHLPGISHCTRENGDDGRILTRTRDERYRRIKLVAAMRLECSLTPRPFLEKRL